MTPAARLAAAIDVIPAIDDRHRPVAEALKDWGVAHRFAGSGDRAAIGNLVYDALRWRRSTAWLMDDDSSRSLVLGVVAYRWGLGVDRLATMLAGDRHGPPPLTDAEAARIAAADLSLAPPAAAGDVPDWLVPSLERAFGADWAAEAAALALRPPLDVRANALKADRDRVLKALERFGVAPARFAPMGVRIAATEGEGRHPNVQVEPGFLKGWFEVQDEGSQLAAHLVAAEPGQQVLDLCAGAGGKTLALAASMGNRGQLHATDAEPSRLAPIYDRLKRAGTRNVQVLPAGDLPALAALHGRMDRVLVDSPCTGTGTWRRRPDAKWRLTGRQLSERTAQQDALLASAAGYVRPGGRLVYVTCSVLPEENADRASAFLAGHSDFSPATVAEMLAAAPLADGTGFRAAIHEMPVGIQMTPRRTGTDGFYVAVLVRR